MVEKTLSTSTLSLRFMQHARRTRVEPEHAPVKDDAEWAVPPETRQAWAAYRVEKAVTYETSYLPFLFPSLHDTPAADRSSSASPSDTLRPRGRRAFNKRGEEITSEPSSASSDTAPQANIDQRDPEPTKKTRPHAISSTGSASATARSKIAKHVIFDNSGVGTDLTHQGTPFLRPQGVDPPVDAANTASQPSGSKPNVKRPRTAAQSDKANKKTRLAQIE